MKRVQEHQIESRYSNSRAVQEEPDPGTGIERASQDVLERRKIVSVSRRKFGAGTASKTPSSAAPAAAATATTSSAPNNPFASTILARPTTSSFSFNSGGNQPSQSSQSKPNPFANVTFTNSNSGATNNSAMAPPPAATPKFSFTSSTVAPSTSSTAYQPPAANSTFAIGTSNITTPSSQPMTALAKRNKEIRDLNIVLWQTIIDHYEGGQKAADYSGFLKEYLKHAEKIQEEYEAAVEEEDRLSNESKPAASSVTSEGTSTSNQPQPASSSWSLFGATAPAAAPSSTDRPSVPFSFSATGPSSSTPSFSFGATTSAVSTNSSAPTFSFGATTSAPSTTSAHGGDEENEEDDDPTANPDDGEVEFVERAENTEEEVLYEVRAIPLKKENNEWKKRATGALRVYRHKITRTHRMAVRNEYGKVHFNVAVSSGMKFEKVEKNGKGGKKVTYVRFLAVEEESKGGELFMLQVKPESLDEFHYLLTSLV